MTRGVYAVGIVVVSFFISLWTMDRYFPLCPQGRTSPLNRPYQSFGKSSFAYVAAAPLLDALSDSSDHPKQSDLMVCEAGRPLGPAHSIHSEIASKGAGRFSHWQGIGFVFSASDNSDPNTNGRSYVVVQTR